MVDGWVGGWMEGRQSQVKDYLQQSKKDLALVLAASEETHLQKIIGRLFVTLYNFALKAQEDIRKRLCI